MSTDSPESARISAPPVKLAPKPNNQLLALLAPVFVVMVGFGVALPVLPFYAERLSLASGATGRAVALHVGLLTSAYALMQFFFAPLWGRWSDRIGRTRLVLLGIGGSAISQIMFGVADSLWVLYAARVLGGIMGAATLPAAAAYVADKTTKHDRARGMGWLGTAVSLGTVVGVAVGGLATRKDLHFGGRYACFRIDSFSIPFFAAAALMLFAMLLAVRALPYTSSIRPRAPGDSSGNWRELGMRLRLPLGLALSAQFGLALFEGTFPLYAQQRLGFGPGEVGASFIVCGLVMALFQSAALPYLSGRVSEISQIAFGFAVMGVGLTLLSMVRVVPLVLGVVGLVALGVALVFPNLSVLTANRGAPYTGAALGMQNSANSLGQVGGPLLGGIVFAWRPAAPYLLAGALLAALAVIAGSIKEKSGAGST